MNQSENPPPAVQSVEKNESSCFVLSFFSKVKFAVIPVLFASALIIFFRESGCQSSMEEKETEQCLINFFKCFEKDSTRKQFREAEVTCCEKLLTNISYSFVSTFEDCIREQYAISVMFSCITTLGEECGKAMPKIFLERMEDYEEFGRKLVQSVKMPTDVQDCKRFAIDYEANKYQLCHTNMEKRLQEMCNAITSIFR